MRLLLATAVLTASFCLGAAPAYSFVYWTNTSATPGSNTAAISRADLDGTNVRHRFIPGFSSRALAVDAGRVYFDTFDGTQAEPFAIGRATIDGSAVNSRFIPAISSQIAVDATHVYWAALGQNAIGRANIDGSGRNPAFMSASNADAVAVDATHLYWGTGSTIGRAKLDGSEPNPNFIVLFPANGANNITVTGSHIYWSDGSAGSIGRADIDGTNVNPSLVSGIAGPIGVAVNGSHIYWAAAGFNNPDLGAIGRANLDGTGVQHRLVAAPGGPVGIAIDARATIPTTTTVTSSSPSIFFGEDPTFTATVANVPAGQPAPAGTIQFKVNGVADGSPIAVGAGGQAQFSPQFLLNVGDSVTAEYLGDFQHAASAASATQQVKPAVSSMALTSSANPVTSAGEVVILATVSNASTAITPFGSVQFFVDGDPVLTPLPLDEDGEAGIVAEGLDPGEYVIEARFTDDTGIPADFTPSQASLTQRVTAPVSPPPPPLPPPPPPTPPAISAPTISSGARASTTRSAGRVVVRSGQVVHCPGSGPSCRVVVSGRAGRTQVGRTTRTIAAGRSAAVALTLNRKGARMLRTRRRLRVTISTTASRAGAGAAVTARRVLSVRPPAQRPRARG